MHWISILAKGCIWKFTPVSSLSKFVRIFFTYTFMFWRTNNLVKKPPSKNILRNVLQNVYGGDPKGEKGEPPAELFSTTREHLRSFAWKMLQCIKFSWTNFECKLPRRLFSAHVQMQNFKRKSEFFSAKNIIVTVFKVLNILRKLWKVSSFYKMKLIGDVNFQIYRRYQKKLFLVIKCTFQFLTICASRVLRRWRISPSR